MSAKGVLVTSHDKSGNFIFRSSAVFFNDVILLHGNHLTPLLEQVKWKEILKSVDVNITQNGDVIAFLDDNLNFEVSEEVEDTLPETVETVGRRFVTGGVWRCPLVGKSLEMLRTVEDDAVLSCLSLFVILKTPGDVSPLAEMIPRWVYDLEMPVWGGSVIVETTPAGMQVFINSWSHGVVARMFGRHDCMFLTDAVYHSDCTGAPIYKAVHSRSNTIHKGSLLGIILGRKDNFTCGIALLPVLTRIAPTAELPPRVTPQSNLRRLVDGTVCMISSGDLRGSGVVVDAGRGVVLTCSHVIQNDAASVEMHLKNDIFTCDVIYRVESCDVAVLKVSPKNLLNGHMEIAESPARTGDIVCLAGFPQVLPPRENDFRPYINFGCVSKSLPHAIVVNCTVSKGNSGGPVIRDQKLLGLVSFIETGVSGFGVVVPATVFLDHIRKYIETDNVAHLKDLESKNVKRYWNYCKL